jgi:LytS/YehU family sensor histidine kinase
VLIVLFSAVRTYVWMLALIETNVWSIEELKKTQPDLFFYQVYVYNLFPILLTLSGWVLIYFLVHYVEDIRKQEQEKAVCKYQMLELEAKALRAQMNPHFIYNCMTSIKALIQNDEKARSIEYLTAFSKLIRVLFQNSDKRQISLHDEIETCRLYAQLESMRLSGKL